MACAWAQGPQSWQFPAAQAGLEENKRHYKQMHAVKGEEVEVALGVEEEGRAPGLVFGVRSLGARVRDDFLRGRGRVGTAVSDVRGS